MNMEAMGVLSDTDNMSQQHNQSMMQTNNHSMMNMMNMSQMGMNQQNQTQRNLGQSNIVQMTSQKSLNYQNNTSVLMGKVKTESKEHRWK